MDYSAVFGERAGRYIQACEQWPAIRAEEFSVFLNQLSLRQGERFLDLPCGNGVLADRVPDDCRYTGLDPAMPFVQACTDAGHNCHRASLRETGLADNHFDVLGSLTGVHHEKNRLALYAEWFRLLKPGGRLIVTDVWTGSPVGIFLNGFVDEWNSQGHCGEFLADADLALLTEAGFTAITLCHVHYAWRADSESDMYHFMCHLFGLDRGPELADLQQAWQQLGWQPDAQACCIPWSLAVLTASKPA